MINYKVAQYQYFTGYESVSNKYPPQTAEPWHKDHLFTQILQEMCPYTVWTQVCVCVCVSHIRYIQSYISPEPQGWPPCFICK